VGVKTYARIKHQVSTKLEQDQLADVIGVHKSGDVEVGGWCLLPEGAAIEAKAWLLVEYS